jgi:hypothetical protein
MLAFIRSRIGILILATSALLVGGAGVAVAATGVAGNGTPEYCVLHGPAGHHDATGNWVLYNWSRTACPRGTYGHTSPGTGGTAPADSDPFIPSVLNVGHQANGPVDTTFQLTDNSTQPAGVFTCHLTSPVAVVPATTPATYQPGIVCTKS